MDTSTFELYREQITRLDLSVMRSWPESLRMRTAGGWSTYYAPFEYVNPAARLVVLGITPGLTQALNALRAAQVGIAQGLGSDDVLARAKVFASFSGPMRSNLVALLDRIGIARWLGISSAADLFGQHSDAVNFTSVLRYPVVFNGKNYGGTPGIVETGYLREELERSLLSEVDALPNAVYVPLGPAVTDALNWLCRNGRLDAERVLRGLPHPSGANAERIAYFLGRKARVALSNKVNADRLDQSRAALEAQVTRLMSL